MTSWQFLLYDNMCPEKCPREKSPPEKSPEKIALQENCFIKFLLLLTLSYGCSFI